MPKMRTHSSSKKRFKKNKAGKVKRSKAYTGHHAWAKSKKQRRHLGEAVYFTGADEKRMEVLLPY